MASSTEAVHTIFVTYLLRNKMLTQQNVAFVLNRSTRTVRRWTKRVEKLETPEQVRGVVMPTMKADLQKVIAIWDASHTPEQRPTTHHLPQELIKHFPECWVAHQAVGAKYSKPSGAERALKKKMAAEEKKKKAAAAKAKAGTKRSEREEEDDKAEQKGEAMADEIDSSSDDDDDESLS